MVSLHNFIIVQYSSVKIKSIKKFKFKNVNAGD